MSNHEFDEIVEVFVKGRVICASCFESDFNDLEKRDYLSNSCKKSVRFICLLCGRQL